MIIPYIAVGPRKLENQKKNIPIDQLTDWLIDYLAYNKDLQKIIIPLEPCIINSWEKQNRIQTENLQVLVM